MGQGRAVGGLSQTAGGVMAIFGCCVSILIGLWLLVGSFGAMWLALGFTGKFGLESVVCGGAALIGVWMIWFGFASLPFKIVAV
jgi:hypothetical protein